MALPTGVTIRRAEVADAERVAHLQLDCWDDAYTGLIPQNVLDEARRKIDDRVETWRSQLSAGGDVLVAEAANELAHELVGFASFGPPRDDDVEPDLELYAIYVRAEWWGTGLGHALYREAVGDRPAYLWVVEGNHRAMGFYERQGFRMDGTSKERPEGVHLRMVRRGKP